MMLYLTEITWFVVRRSGHLIAFQMNTREDVESMLSDASYVNIALALDALCKAFPDEKTTIY